MEVFLADRRLASTTKGKLTLRSYRKDYAAFQEELRIYNNSVHPEASLQGSTRQLLVT
jgi:hypothetical protein